MVLYLNYLLFIIFVITETKTIQTENGPTRKQSAIIESQKGRDRNPEGCIQVSGASVRLFQKNYIHPPDFT